MSQVGYHLGHETQASKVMYLDSRDGAQIGTGTEFSYVFEDALVTREDEGMLVSLLSATIPYSFYNIRAGVNDAMKFTVATLSGGSSWIFSQNPARFMWSLASRAPAILSSRRPRI